MSDLYDRADIPVARGRRDPELAARLDIEDDDATFADPGTEGAGYIGLVQGDQVIAKVSIAVPTTMGEAWFTYGATTHVMPGETELDAFQRTADVVNTRVLDLATDALERANEFQAEQMEQVRRRRITPRG